MKTPTKVILLSIVVIIFILALYFCLPTIPKKIKNEIKGTDYTFENITFNLPHNNYIVNEELTNQLLNEQSDQNDYKVMFLINNQNEKDYITIMRNSDDGYGFIKETISNLKNPFKHRTLVRQAKKQNNLISSVFTLFNSPTKEVVLNRNTTEGRLAIYTVDLIIDNTFYTIIPSVVAGEEAALEFIRTVAVK
jgi:hypothetical protein